MSFGSSFTDILTGKLSPEDHYMQQVDEDIKQKKPLLSLVYYGAFYAAGLSEILIAKGLMTREEDNALTEAAKEKTEKELDKQISEACEMARKKFADKYGTFGNEKESGANGSI